MTKSQLIMDGNTITDLGNTPFDLLEAIAFVTRNDAVGTVAVKNSFVDNIGNIGIGNADALLFALDGRSQQDILIQNHTFRNTNKVGGNSSTGIEFLTLGGGDGNRIDFRLEDSDLRDTSWDGVQIVDFGGNSEFNCHIENTRITNSARDGISIFLASSNTDAIDVTLLDNTIDGFQRAGIAFQATNPVDSFVMRQEGNDIVNGRDALVFLNWANATASSSIDLGGGSLGGNGLNRIINNSGFSTFALHYDVVAESNWWGSPAGPAPSSFLLWGSATVDYEPFLIADPRPGAAKIALGAAASAPAAHNYGLAAETDPGLAPSGGSAWTAQSAASNSFAPTAQTATEELDVEVEIAPNPFNSSTLIRYNLPTAGNVKLAIYNMLGQEIRVLVDAFRPSGVSSIQWDGRDYAGQSAATGTYFFRLETESQVANWKMMLAK